MAKGKASSKKSPPTTTTKSSGAALVVVQIAISISALSLAVFVSSKVLAPLFGEFATKLYLEDYSTILVLLLFLEALPAGFILRRTQLVVLGSLLCGAPPAIHWIATHTARAGGPCLGPLISFIPSLVAIAYMAMDGVRGVLAGRPHTFKAFTDIGISVFVVQSQRFWSYIPFTRTFSPALLLVVSGWIIACSSLLFYNLPVAKPRTPRKPVSIYIPILSLILTTILALTTPPTHLPTLPFSVPDKLRILSSTPSITGRIVVGEDFLHGFRYLRADHSLLGGVWVGNERLARLDGDTEWITDANGEKLGDSIYSAFVLQEAARLQQRETKQENALIIGLGAGIAAQSFVSHNLSTTIVEIDPAVYDAARTYFGLPEPKEVFLEDARDWVHQRANAESSTGMYDIVVHDCFSGGGVPKHLFTKEFWSELRTIVNPGGIVAVNYAGIIGSDSSKAVYATLKDSFGQCRAFHDYHTNAPVEKLMEEFINLVFFCTPSPSPLTFRPAEQADYLSSYLRRHVLGVLEQREIKEELILGTAAGTPLEKSEMTKWILTDANNPLGGWQNKGALEHWKVMRSVLDDYVWNTY